MDLPYHEGSIFWIPLVPDGYARGVVARSAPAGEILLGYFFGPIFADKDALRTTDLDPSQAVLRIRFGDLGLINGSWQVYSEIPNWRREDWPIPKFVHRDPLGRLKPRLIEYSDDDPSKREIILEIENADEYERDGLSGYILVEKKLSKLLRG